MRTYIKQLIRVVRAMGREPEWGFEIGVWRGALSAVLLRTFPKMVLVMVDSWEPYKVACLNTSDAGMMEAERLARQATGFAGERRIILKATSEVAARLVSAYLIDSFDFGFVDANHTYEYVSQDLRLWWPLIREGGVLAGHDYRSRNNKSGVWGVKRAVDEFVAEQGRELTTKWNVWSIVK